MLGIVLVNYKTIDRTVNYVSNELSKISIPWKLVIVNNCCTDESNQALAEGCGGCLLIGAEAIEPKAKVYILGHKDNLGYAKGNNLGAEFLTRYFDINYFLFTNNDLKLVDENVVEKLIEKAEQDYAIGAIGPKIVGLNGLDQSPGRYLSIWRKNILRRLCYPLLAIKRDASFFNEIIQNATEGYYYRLMGSFILVRASAFQSAGGFDPNTFLYGEEQILSERLKKQNYKTYYYNAVSVIHEHSKIISNYRSLKSMMVLDHKSNVYYYRRYMKSNIFEISLSYLSMWLFINLYWPLSQFIKKQIDKLSQL